MGTISSMLRIGRTGISARHRSIRRPGLPAIIEAVGWTRGRVVSSQFGGTGASAIMEPLESRWLLSATFNAYIVGGATGAPSPATYGVNLYTTGGQATKWIVDWGDGTTPDTFLASKYQGGVFPTPFTVSHKYATNTYTITATATPVSGPAVTATFALNSTFSGNPADPNGGTSTATPAGDTGSGAGRAIAIDTSGTTYNGYIYCLSS